MTTEISPGKQHGAHVLNSHFEEAAPSISCKKMQQFLLENFDIFTLQNARHCCSEMSIMLTNKQAEISTGGFS